jgi:hypothetical protein
MHLISMKVKVIRQYGLGAQKKNSTYACLLQASFTTTTRTNLILT